MLTSLVDSLVSALSAMVSDLTNDTGSLGEAKAMLEKMGAQSADYRSSQTTQHEQERLNSFENCLS